MKKILNSKLLTIWFLLIPFTSISQDIQYSQFYSNPIYLNPAFAGSHQMSRLGFNYRNQWSGLNQTIQSFSTSYDTYLSQYSSGVALIINKSNQSQNHLSVSDLGFVYSYKLKLSYNWDLRFGGQVSYIVRDAYFGNLIFGSQIDNMGNISSFSGENLGLDFKHNFFDYSAGMLINNESVWFGISSHHLNKPNISFISGEKSNLPIIISSHGGVKFNISRSYNSKRELLVAYNYKLQEPFHQLDLGTQLNMEPLVLGIWYRGIPINKYAHESMVGLVGLKLKNGLSVGYSYDYSLSSLTNANSGGSHELSLNILMASKESKSSMPCFIY